MITLLGQDMLDHLHERGGPLDLETWGDRRECAGCGYEPDEDEILHTVTRAGYRTDLCDVCALEYVREVFARMPARDRDERESLEVLRAITEKQCRIAGLDNGRRSR